MTDDEIKEAVERLRGAGISVVGPTGVIPEDPIWEVAIEEGRVVLNTIGMQEAMEKYAHMLAPTELVGYVQTLDPTAEPPANWQVHWTIPSVFENNDAPPSTTTIKSDLTGLAKHTYTHTTPCWDDFKQWDECVKEEAAQRLESPKTTVANLEEAYRDLESLDSLIENIDEELSEEGFDYNYEFGRIQMELTRLYHHLERALHLLKQNEIDFRLPDLLRNGCKRSGLVANPYPQHMHVKADERQIQKDLRRLGFLVGDPGRSDEDDQELHAIRARLRAQGRDPGWDPVERTC